MLFEHPARGAAFLGAASILLAACGGAAAPSPTSSAAPSQPPASSAAAAKPSGSAAAAGSASAKPAARGAAAAQGSGRGANAPAPLNPPVKVKIGSNGFGGEAGEYLALDKGYFKDEGIDIEFVPGMFGSAGQIALRAGDVDLLTAAIDPSTFNASARGIDQKLVAPLTYIPPDDKNASIVVRQDLIDSGKVKGPADLKGLTIGIGGSAGTSSQYFVDTYLAKGNLKASDTNETTINFQDMLAAFAGKKLDAAWEIEPLATAAEDQHLAKEVAWAGELILNYDPFTYIASAKFSANKDVLNRFMTAWLRGQRDYYNAYQKNIGGQAAKDEVIQSLAKHTTVKKPEVWAELTEKGRMHSVDPNGEFHMQGFQVMEDYFLKVGTLKEKYDISQAIDPSAVQAAVQRLGRVS
jgi:NitT/TauT family transport system substrate-binding protein